MSHRTEKWLFLIVTMSSLVACNLTNSSNIPVSISVDKTLEADAVNQLVQTYFTQTSEARQANQTQAIETATQTENAIQSLPTQTVSANQGLPTLQPASIPTNEPTLDNNSRELPAVQNGPSPIWNVVPWTCQQCGGGGGNFTPIDADQDGMDDSTEEYIAQKFAPYYIFDEDEISARPCTDVHAIFSAMDTSCIHLPDEPIPPINWIYQVRPGVIYDDTSTMESYCIENNQLVECENNPDSKPYMLLVITSLFDEDYVEVKTGVSLNWHYGDTESLEIYIECQSGDCNTGPYWVYGVQINRHSSGVWHDEEDLTWVDAYGKTGTDYSTHPTIYVSQGKHGQYISMYECTNSYIEGGFQEQCGEGWAGVPPLAGLPTNIGEMNFPFWGAQDFINIVFPSERVWDPNYSFCGGEYVTSIDFRNGKDNFLGVADVPYCAGAIGGKWYPFDVQDKRRQRPNFYSPIKANISFVNRSNQDICQIRMGYPNSTNPADGAKVATVIMNQGKITPGGSWTTPMMTNIPLWFNFITCSNVDLYQAIYTFGFNGNIYFP